MATRYEYYITGDNTQSWIRDVNWRAQTFTPSVSHKITSVKLKLYRYIGLPGTITVSIRATSGGYPTGGDLCVGYTDGNTLTDVSPGEWREITLGAGYILDASTKYAIVVRALDGDSSNYLNWRMDTGGTYAGGAFFLSENSGASWELYAGYDFMFEEWGEPPVTAPTATTQAVTDIAAATATGNGNMTDNGGENASKRGVCWNTTGNPTVADDKSEETDSFGTGAFERPMTGLSPDTHYYVKAYAHNSAGYGYGGQVEFDTPPLTQKEVADTGSGVDATPSIAVALSLAETGEGVDTTPVLSASIPIQDSGSGVEAILGEFTKLLADLGSGADLIALIQATLSLAETGSGVDAVNVNYYVSFVNVGDVGSGADVISLDITIPAIEDSGVGVEAILGEYTKVVADKIYSSEYLGPVVASMIVSELAAGEDAIAVQITPIIAETGVALESVVIAASLTVAEAGSGVDAPSVTVTLTIPEVGAGVDSALAAFSITIADTGEGIETILSRVLQLARLFIMTRSKVRMTVKTTHKARIKLTFKGGGQR